MSLSDTTLTPILSVHHLSIAFTHRTGVSIALKKISFDLYHNEVLALVGESGSGKSLTALSILGLLPHNAVVTGRIHYQDTELLTAPPAQLRQLRGKRIAMIFQDPRLALDPVFTIGQQITEVLLAHHIVNNKKAALNKAQYLLELVEIPRAKERLDTYPHQLSGGQCQRVMIAMALACDPELLIADEPTTALDATVQREILQTLRRLRERINISILLITHDMGVVAEIADRVMVLRHGQVEEINDKVTLFTAPKADYTKALLAAMPHYPEPKENNIVDVNFNYVSVKDLTVTYQQNGKSFTALDNISLTLPHHSFTGIVGESGSGKSTLGRTIAGLIKPTAGDIHIGATSIIHAHKKELHALRQQIGFVFQSPRSSLNPCYTIAQSIAEPLITHTNTSKKQIAEQVDELLRQVGLDVQWRHRFPHELSGGQCQRVAIARALALKPTLLIADEPTSALDVSVQAHILELLQRLQQEYQFSCLFISHDLAVVGQLCEQVIVLQSGHIVERGHVNQVLHHPTHAYTQKLIDSVLHPIHQVA